MKRPRDRCRVRVARLGSTATTDNPARRSSGVKWRIETAKDLLNIIQVQLSELLESDVETAIKSRAVAQLCGVAKGIIELTDIEQDIDAVEQAVKEKQPAKSWKEEAF